MDLIALFGNEINGIPRVDIWVKVGLQHEERSVAEASIRRWLEKQFQDEWDRQRQQSVRSDINEGLAYSMDTPDLIVAPESTRAYLKPPTEGVPEPAPDPSAPLMTVTGHRAGVVVNEVDPDGERWVARAQNADLYVEKDGQVWDHKPTLLDRILRRKPTMTVRV